MRHAWRELWGVKVGGSLGALWKVLFGWICLKPSALEGIWDHENRCCHLGEYSKRGEGGIGPGAWGAWGAWAGSLWARNERSGQGGNPHFVWEKTDSWEPRSTKTWMDKANTVCTNNGILLRLEKEFWHSLERNSDVLMRGKTCINFEDVMLNETNETQIEQLLYDSTYMKYLK